MSDNDRRRRWGLPIPRKDLHDEVAEEIAFHIEQRTQKLIDSGRAPSQAADEARRRFGNINHVHKECLHLSQQTQRQQQRVQIFGELLHDARYALRGLRRRPAFALSAILTLALGIGGTTAIYSLLDTVLLRSLPYNEPERLVSMWSWSASESQYVGFKGLTQFEDVAGSSAGFRTLTGREEPARVASAKVTPSFFTTLGVNPLMGRGFIEADARKESAKTVILSAGFWHERYSSDPEILDRAIYLDGVPHSVIGIMPASLRLPSGDTRLWTTFSLSNSGSGFYWGQAYLDLFGRLADGVSFDTAQLAAHAMTEQQRLDNPTWRPNKEWTQGVSVQPYQQTLAGSLSGLLSLLFYAALAVLLVVCVNVANLFLSRATAKQDETAIRASLGASRIRLLQLSLVEAWVVGLAGTSLGLGLALALMRWLPNQLPGLDARFGTVSLDGRVLSFALLLSIITSLLFGTVPALRYTRIQGLSKAVRGTRGGNHQGGLSSAMVVAQLAFSLLLLMAAAILLGGLRFQLNAETGLQPERVVAAQLDPANADYKDRSKQARFYQEVLATLGALPTVESVAAASTLPFGTTFGTAFDAPDREFDPNQLPFAFFRRITPGYFRTLGIPLLLGRDFSHAETRDEDGCTKEARCQAIVDEVLAKQVWPEGNPLGKTIGADWLGWFEIIGVAAHANVAVVDEERQSMLYLPQNQVPQSALALVVRTRTSAQEIEQAVLAAVRGVDRQVPVTDVRTLSDDLWASTSNTRLAASLISVFALVALLLAAIGIYGVMSYRADQRSREMGIRLALGSSVQHLQRRELLHVAALCGLGIVSGAAISFTALRFLGASALLEETAGQWTLSPELWLGLPLLLLAVALLAGWIPARRASRLDPLEALRVE